MTGAEAQHRWPPLRHWAIVSLVCLVVYWPRLGATGFSATEGHRVIPGWEMLQTRQWLLPRMFGQIYLRKPPGMAWAEAASSALLGQTEFAARAVSAAASTAMALVALFFGARWFGRRFGVAAGVATALTPWFWSSGRSAEIEALNNLATQVSVLLLLELLVPQEGRRQAKTVVLGVFAGLAIAATGLVKGPAGFAAIGGAIFAGLAIGRGRDGRAFPEFLRVLPGLLIAVVLGLGVLVAARDGIARAVIASGEEPVLQNVSEFLWGGRSLTAAGIGKVLAMPPLALLAAMPASLALLLPWGRDAWAESGVPRRAFQLSRALALACLVSLGLLAAAGVSNPRYAMPSLSFVPVLAGYAALGWAGAFGNVRRRIASWFFLRARYAWPALLVSGAIFYIAVIEPRARATSGREAGLQIGKLLPAGAMVWADHTIEARPEVLLYAQRQSGATVRWIPGMARGALVPRRGFLLLRADPESGELAAYAGLRLIERGRWHVHRYDFVLLERTGE